MNAKRIEVPEDETPVAPQPKRVVLVQLNRLGDLIQTVQVASSLKAHSPDLRVDIVARELFAPPLRFLLDEVFDHVYTVGAGDIFDQRSTIESSLAGLTDTLEQVNRAPVNLLINMSFSKSSSFLCGLIKAEHRFGQHFQAETATHDIKDKWSQYIFSTVMSGPLNGLHLNDLFGLIIGIRLNPEVHADQKTQGEIFVAPFASHAKKHWRIEKWAEVVYKLARVYPEKKIVILGGKSDLSSAEQLVHHPLIKSLDNVHHLVGVASLRELYERFDGNSLLLGHDSMLSHLAALRGMRTLTISLGTTRPAETAPYGSGHVILAPRSKCYPCFPNDRCESFACHSDISYQLAVETAVLLTSSLEFNMENLKQNVSDFHLASCDVYQTSFDDSGLLNVNLLSDNLPSTQSLVRNLYRKTFLYFYEEFEEFTPVPRLSDQTKANLQNIRNGFRQAFDLAQFGKTFSRYILEEIASPTPNIENIKAHGNKIDEIDRLFVDLSRSIQALSPISNMVLLKKANLSGAHIVHLTEQTFIVYNDIDVITRVMHELLEALAQNVNKDSVKQKTMNV
jgi:ADP-heptose:LPS heptosyltransferase